MPGQGFILGVGAIGYPAEYEGADPHTVARLGISKVITLTSTYDHRVIQGAESGEFLRGDPRPAARRARLLRRHLPAASACPYEPARWTTDIEPARRRGRAQREGRPRPPAHQHVPGARAPHREPRPARPARARHPPRARHQPPRPQHLGPRPRVPGRQPRRRHARPEGDAAARDPRRGARRVRPHGRRRVHAHPGSRPEGMDPDAASRRPSASVRARGAAPHPRPAERGRGVRGVPRQEVPRAEALQPRGRGVAHPDARRAARRPRPTAG